MKIFVPSLLMIPFIVLCGINIYFSVVFWNNVGGHLKRAADSNTVETAKQELDKALDYLEKRKMTDGDTSVFYSTPETDIEFWYKNLKSSQEELAKVSSETSQLEKTNILMKLRETLLDHGDKGDDVTCPPRIEDYPIQSLMFFIGIITFVMFAIGGITHFVILED